MGSESDSDIYIECSPVGTSDENVLTGIYKDKYIRLEDRIDRESNRVINKIKKILHEKKSCSSSSDSFRGYREGNSESCDNDDDEDIESRASYLWRNTKIIAGVNCPRRIKKVRKKLKENEVLTDRSQWGSTLGWGEMSRKKTVKKIRDEFCEGDNYCKYKYDPDEGPLCVSASENIFLNTIKYINYIYKITINKNIDWVRGLFIGLISIIVFNKLLNKLENKSVVKT